jgi:hypothetical protein
MKLTDEMKVIIGIIILIGILCFYRWCIDKKDNDENNKLKYNNVIKYINKGKDIESLIDDCIDNKVIFTLWVGDNDLTQNRYDGLMSIQNMKGTNMINVNPDNIDMFIKDEYPIHKSYKYLSLIHKSDYLRCYLMYHWGGGYSDIKKYSNNTTWKEHFNEIKNNGNIWMIGAPSDGIAYPEENDIKLNKLLDVNFKKLSGVGYFIYKPYTKLTTEWYDKLHERLDYYYPQLKKHPAIYSRESYDRPPSKWCNDEKDNRIKKQSCPKKPTKYPISWNRILGQINYPIQLDYLQHILVNIKLPYNNNYM